MIKNHPHIGLALKIAGRRNFCAALAASPWIGGTSFARAQTWEERSQPALPIRVLDLDWQDEARFRLVLCRLYLPRQAALSTSRVPLVCFAHGMGGSASTYRYLGHHLASNGVASLHLQPHARVAPLTAPSVRSGLPDRQLQQARQFEALALAQDTRFALDRIFNGPFADLFDAQACVAAGHGWGALTPLLLAGAPLLPDRRATRLVDVRIKAAVLLSAPALDTERPLDQSLASVLIPTLHITAARDVMRMPGRTVGLQDRLSVYRHVGSVSKALAVFQGGASNVFTDSSLSAGPEVNRQIKDATQDLFISFMAEFTGAGPDRLLDWHQRHHDIVERFDRQG